MTTAWIVTYWPEEHVHRALGDRGVSLFLDFSDAVTFMLEWEGSTIVEVLVGPPGREGAPAGAPFFHLPVDRGHPAAAGYSL